MPCKMSLAFVLLENSPGRVSTSVPTAFPFPPTLVLSPACSTSFPRLLQRHPETSRYHPNINSRKNVEEKDKSTRRNGCFAIGRNRSGNTRISFRNLEGVREAVHLENMHLHGASASLHAPASSLTLQAFLLARKIPAAMLAEFFPSPNCPETIRNATVRECVTLEETKLI